MVRLRRPVVRLDGRTLKPLGRRETYDLVTRWQKRGDVAARNRLVLANVGLIASVVRGFKRPAQEWNDLFQEASLGLMTAIDKFDVTRGVGLATYAVYWMQHGVRRGIDRVSQAAVALPANDSEGIRKARRARRELLTQGITPTDEAVVEALARAGGRGTRVATLAALRMAEAEVVSLDAPLVGFDRPRELVDANPSPEDQLCEAEEGRRRSEMLARALAALSPRERHIVERRHLAEEPATLSEVGQDQEFARMRSGRGRGRGVSRERVRQIEVQALTRLRAALQEEETT